jgi:hypothetical protein
VLVYPFEANNALDLPSLIRSHKGRISPRIGECIKCGDSFTSLEVSGVHKAGDMAGLVGIDVTSAGKASSMYHAAQPSHT